MDSISRNICTLFNSILCSHVLFYLTRTSEAVVVLNLTKLNNSQNVTKPSLTFLYHATCEYNGDVYPVGQFSPLSCVSCDCNGITGDVTCEITNCPTIPNCIRYTYIKDKCCPCCTEYGCYYNETLYSAGSRINMDSCTKCYCPWDVAVSGGDVTCVTIECDAPRCVDAVTLPGKCCPSCPNGPNCYLDDVIINEGEHVYVDNCRDCYCSDDDHVMSNAPPRQATCSRSFFCL